MRIIAGELKNRIIFKPPERGLATTSEMVREALFNILGEAVVDSRFADLFCGSGSVGLEALSRGAQRVTFVEKKRSIAERVKQTLAHHGIESGRARVWLNDVFQMGENPSVWAQWDIAFLDPPLKVRDNFLDILAARGILVPGTVIAVQRPADFPPVFRSGNLRLLDQRKYGRTALYFFS
ncbi:MAG TPA: 16S rRNA (guanine(966)-N(2))-methyltransferase RsmD [bacterium]|nr:16S rRNA (guanine(966)-N(2))-methyltransferase RsmD [bacterium]